MIRLDRAKIESAKPGVIPPLETLRREGLATSLEITTLEKTVRQACKALFVAYMHQARRLWIAAELHNLQSARFVAFAKDIGVGRSVAYDLMKLYPHRQKLLRQCRRTSNWPRWQAALEWIKCGANENDSFEQTTNILPPQEDRGIEWGTPQDLFDHYDAIHHFDCDVAASAQLAKCKRFITREQNGLTVAWGKRNWLNPPYQNIAAWCARAWQVAQDGALVVALLPVYTEQTFFQRYCIHGEIEFLQGRLSFVGGKGFCPFATMIVTWREQSAMVDGRLAVRIAGHKLGLRKIIAGALADQ
jgi:phage N-6-adenine-methyltransferase